MHDLPPPGYDRNVFINCPFDAEYKPIFDAIVFAVLDLQFNVKCALEKSDSGEVRYGMLADLISQSKYGIHDLSRIQTSVVGGINYPRFNMPFELGLFLGGKLWQEYPKVCLVLDSRRFAYHISLSDIAGQDAEHHNDDPAQAVACVCSWLSNCSDSPHPLPGGITVFKRYRQFRKVLPSMCRKYYKQVGEISFNEYKTMVGLWITGNTLVLAPPTTAATK